MIYDGLLLTDSDLYGQSISKGEKVTLDCKYVLVPIVKLTLGTFIAYLLSCYTNTEYPNIFTYNLNLHKG